MPPKPSIKIIMTAEMKERVEAAALAKGLTPSDFMVSKVEKMLGPDVEVLAKVPMTAEIPVEHRLPVSQPTHMPHPCAFLRPEVPRGYRVGEVQGVCGTDGRVCNWPAAVYKSCLNARPRMVTGNFKRPR